MASVDTTTPVHSDHERRDARHHRRRPLRWIVPLVVVVLLVVVAAIGELVVRGVVENDIRQRLATALSLPADGDIEVDVAGLVIPQLIAGSLQDVTVTGEDVPIGSATGEVTLQASGVPVRGGGSLGAATAQVVIDGDDVASLLSSDASVKDVTLAAPDLTATVTVAVDGSSVDAVIAYAPSVSGGDLVLTPQSFQVDGETLTPDQVRAEYAAVAPGVADPRTVCVKADVPAGFTLSDVTVRGDDLVARFDVAGGILDDASLQAKGTCSG